MSNNQDERYQQAKKRVKEIKGFYEHLASYLSVNLLLIVINLVTGGGLWFYWITIFWGFGLIMHGLNTFAFPNFLDKDWEERKIQELMGEKPKRQIPPSDDFFENT